MSCKGTTNREVNEKYTFTNEATELVRSRNETQNYKILFYNLQLEYKVAPFVKYLQASLI